MPGQNDPKDQGVTRFSLTDRQQQFVAAYAALKGNAEQAYAVSYGPDLSPAQIAAGARRCLNSAAIRAVLAQEVKQETTADKKKMIHPVTKENIVSALARLAFYDARDVLEWSEDGLRVKASSSLDDDTAFAIEEVVETPRGLRVKLADKRAALVELGRALGLFRETPSRDPAQAMSRAEIEAELDSLRAHQKKT
ncbi:Phage Terminase Small Subunit [Granulibacter bethesdensis]|uniref:Phage Terminase Small Subunit n=1 Tax=Granulibacter bethesdensis TaxID=364410 RepID=A0AAC9P8T9_9PROT|nr:Phage Terminase Small Subunit [Granulibacter bethesdensis]APH62459.1 Phage Terminase Small Subunit [Granulibacter bethesdensis]